MAALTKRVLSTLTRAITAFRSSLRSKRFRVVSEERRGTEFPVLVAPEMERQPKTFALLKPCFLTDVTILRPSQQKRNKPEFLRSIDCNKVFVRMNECNYEYVIVSNQEYMFI